MFALVAFCVVVSLLLASLQHPASRELYVHTRRVLHNLGDTLRAFGSLKRAGQSLEISSTLNKREFGYWQEDTTFSYPPIESLPQFAVEQVEPIPYRPFRWGPNYPITLGIAAMPWSNWLELDSHYQHTLKIRKNRTSLRGKMAERCQPGFLPHAEECLAEMCAFLAQRYPNSFVIRRTTYLPEDPATHGDSIGGKRAGAIVEIENKITGDVFNFEELRRGEGHEWNPMKFAGLLQQDDLAVMVEDDKGEYRFQAGSICTAGFWRLEDKIGRTLHEIHTNGRVPQFREKLKFSMERWVVKLRMPDHDKGYIADIGFDSFFQKQKVSAPVQRNNYFFQIDDQLAWSDHTNGPEDVFDQATKAPRIEVEKDIDFVAPKPTDDFRKIWFRTDRQTLRRMPKTGCILFTIRTYFHPVHELVKEPGVPGRMVSAIKSWPEDVSEYKGGLLYRDLLIPRLEGLHREQIAAGQVAVDASGEVLGRDTRTYPF